MEVLNLSTTTINLCFFSPNYYNNSKPFSSSSSNKPSAAITRKSLSFPFPNKIKPNFNFAFTCCSSSSISKWADRLLPDFHYPSPSSSTSTVADPPPPLPPPILPSSSCFSDRTLPLPIDFYRVLGAETHFLAEGIRRAFESKLSKSPLLGAGGFSQDALLARLQILQTACDTLSNPASRADYDRGLIDNDPDSTLTAHVPWDEVPGTLCVLQEAGETEVVIQVGQKLLKERLPKNFKQDVVLVMVLAYVDISRDAMALNPPDFVECCEVLGRALKLLQVNFS